MCEWTLAVSALSTLAGAASSLQRGREQASLYRYNAALAERQARLAEQAARADAARIRREGEAALGRQRSGFAAAGVALEGSPLDLLGSTAADIDLEAREALYDGAVRAADQRARAGALSHRAAGVATRTALGAGASLLRGGASSFDPGRFPTLG